MGYYVGQARFKAKTGVSAWRGLWVAILLHGLYDFGLMSAMQIGVRGTFDVDEPPADQIAIALGMIVMSLSIFITAAIWTWRIVRKLHREQLAAKDPVNDC
jgi:hypothetical protein